jgi:hypothetical protein
VASCPLHSLILLVPSFACSVPTPRRLSLSTDGTDANSSLVHSLVLQAKALMGGIIDCQNSLC